MKNGLVPIGCVDGRIYKRLSEEKKLNPETFMTIPSLMDVIDERSGRKGKVVLYNGVRMEVLYIGYDNGKYSLYTQMCIVEGEGDQYQENEFTIEDGILKKVKNSYYIDTDKIRPEIIKFKDTGNISNILKKECYLILQRESHKYYGSFNPLDVICEKHYPGDDKTQPVIYEELKIKELEDAFSRVPIDSEKVLNNAHDNMLSWLSGINPEKNISAYLLETSKRSYINSFYSHMKNYNRKKIINFFNDRYKLEPFRFDENGYQHGNWKCDIGKNSVKIYYEVKDAEIEEFEKSITVELMRNDGFKLETIKDWLRLYKLEIKLEKEYKNPHFTN